MNILAGFKKDFSLSAAIAGLIVVLVGMTSSAVIVFQAAQAYGATAADAGSWLGSLCIGMGLLTIGFSLYYKAPVLMAWSTPGAVLLVAAAPGFSLNEAVGAFIICSFLVFLFGVTGWFEKIMSRISVSLTSALLAGVLLHFCLDLFGALKLAPLLVGLMLIGYIAGRRFASRLTMLYVLVIGCTVAFGSGLLKFSEIDLSLTQFHFVQPGFSLAAFISLAVPLFVVNMASQNLTGISVMRAHHYQTPISPSLTGLGLMNMLTAVFGGFSLNYAAITAAIAMGPDAHTDRSRRYVAAVVSGVAYIMIGLFAGTVTSLFAAFPKEMITAIAGLALLGTVSSSLEKALNHPDDKEASFMTFVIAASGLTFFGVSSAFWAIVVGLVVQYLTNKEGAQ